jgi:hypothetical protein
MHIKDNNEQGSAAAPKILPRELIFLLINWLGNSSELKAGQLLFEQPLLT